MEEELKKIVAEAKKSLAEVDSMPRFEAVKAAIVGPSGTFTCVRKNIGKLPKDERPAAGKLINEAKDAIEAALAETLNTLKARELAAKIGPAVDVTLPPPSHYAGCRHPIAQVREELCAIMRRAGFAIAEGPEVETEFFCFDALNTPPEHPARDLQDTYYLPVDAKFGNVSRHAGERYLLSTHTSTVQIREMMKHEPPVRIVSPGRCYRRDTTDATHSASFHQIECLAVDKGISVKDLKAILDYVFKSLLGKESHVRFRPHFFPYTEPSFEVDFYSGHLPKLGKEWVEIGGCGMVDPNVFDAVGYDSKVWTGYAFGFGLERIAMILSGVDDIRYFYQNDVRFIHEFA
jgi:phenylalanyl-tRNA synthetase alpha chain